jgi:hypothetical protein
MTRLMSIALVATFCVAPAASHGAGQTSAPGQTRDARATSAPAPKGTASIAGIVVSADGSAKAIRQANLVIIGAMTGVLRVSSTDRDGRFSFTDLPADRYVISASKPPYLGTVAGARRPARPGTPVVVADGQKITDVTIRMPMGAAIAGVVTDERGQPAANAQVALRQRRLQGVERILVNVPGSATSTDERGRYRIFGLPPGEYIVTAVRGGAATVRVLADADVDAALKGGHVAVPMAFDPNVTSVPVFFPGTTRESDAQPVALTVGEEREGVDIRLELGRNANVEGVISSADGQPVPNVMVFLQTVIGSSPVQMAMSAAVRPDGHFAFAGVRPGSYTLLARTSAPQASQFAAVPVEVAGTDISGIQLTMRPALTLSARLAFDGATPAPSLANRRVSIQSLTSGLTGMAAAQVTPTTATGAFTVTNVMPGQFLIGGPMFFGATADSVTWALQSVVVDGREVTDLPLEIKADAVPKEVVVTYGDRWQELSGRLSQPSGVPASDYTVIVFPADKAYWIPGSRRIRTAHPGTDGRFTLGGPGLTTLPPGAYLLAAVTELDRDEQFDPALLALLTAAAVPVTLQAGEQKTQDLMIK